MDGDHVFGPVERSLSSCPQARRVPKALLVLGMSRSGTSLLTHVLHVLGAALPRDLIGAAHGNPLGHFEPLELVALNNRILESLDRRWSDPRPVPQRWFRSRQAYGYLQYITSQINQSFGNAPLIVIKDPRLCRLLPLYLDALDVLNIEPLVVLQVRPVHEVVQSLVDRDELHPDLAELLWLRSVAEAEWQSRNCRRVWVSMPEIMADWVGTARQIAEALQLEWPTRPDEAVAEIDSLLKPRLWHGARTPGQRRGAGGFSAAAWRAIEQGLAGNEPAAREGFDAVRGALDDLDRMYQPFLMQRAEAQAASSRRLPKPFQVLKRLVSRAHAG